MDIDEVTVVLVVEDISPDMLIELLARQNPAMVEDQVLKQVVFFFCKINIDCRYRSAYVPETCISNSPRVISLAWILNFLLATAFILDNNSTSANGFAR